jgi:phosphoribosyl-AMP cyclohydrolase
MPVRNGKSGLGPHLTVGLQRLRLCWGPGAKPSGGFQGGALIFPNALLRSKMTAMSEQDIVAAIRFDAAGLVPAIAQQHDTGEILMLAWMNRDSVVETIATNRVCYFSRSRNALWRKGETSGQVQHLKELRIDCDGDTLLLLVDQAGVACHTGRRSCFFRAARNGELIEIATPLVSPETLYGGHDTV